MAYLRAGRFKASAKSTPFFDHPADLYLDEALAAPTYGQRVRANVEGAVAVLRGRTGQIQGVKANADDIARARYQQGN